MDHAKEMSFGNDSNLVTVSKSVTRLKKSYSLFPPPPKASAKSKSAPKGGKRSVTSQVLRNEEGMTSETDGEITRDPHD